MGNNTDNHNNNQFIYLCFIQRKFLVVISIYKEFSFLQDSGRGYTNYLFGNWYDFLELFVSITSTR